MPHPARLLADIPAAGWVVVACSVLRSLALCGFALASGTAVDALVSGAGVAGALVSAGILLVIAAGVAAVETLLPPVAQARQERGMREATMRSLLAGPVDDERTSGERAALATDEVERFAHYRAVFLGPLVGAFLIPVVVLVVIAWAISAGIAAGIAVCVALIPPVIAWFMARFRSGSGRFRMISGRLTASFLETIRTLGTVRLLGAEGERRMRLAAQAEALRTEAMRLLRRNQVVLLATDAIFGLVMLSLVGVLAVRGVAGGALTAGTGFALLLLTMLLREPVDHLGRSFYVGLAGRAAGERIAAFLGSAPDHAVALRDEGSRPQSRGDGSAPVLTAESLRVERAGSVVVDGAALSIGRGMTAVVGPSGAGKSSLALALAGLVPSRGIRLRGAPTEASSALLRAEVVYVPQRSTLFTGTVRDNLLLGDPAAEDGTLEAAMEAAGFPRGGGELPDGLDTRVGRGSEGISGGQAQRVSIARALLTGRDVVVADEPTAHLDADAAARVMGTLRSLAQSRTVIVVTHRLAETAAADEVVVMEHGRIVQSGAPETLRTRPGFYAAALEAPHPREGDAREGAG